ncbi:MAG TPA: hypothetical protein VHT24_02535 [Pseudacidobacterium sp.]|jgi:hypothetical protein|nr:hypothetical protein [Pseudacidobacterium sp.]
MNAWMYFWAAWLVISGVAFAGITLIVAVKGFQDLRAMFSGLSGKNLPPRR